MTDRETLCRYRLMEAEETLSDAEKMLNNGLTPRSIMNRAYYSMFYATLALFLHEKIDIKTSRHSGIIGTFDKEFVHSGRIGKTYSKILHKMFDARQEGDYRELVELSAEDARMGVASAREYLAGLKNFMNL